MDWIREFSGWLLAMMALILCSGFFSCSEAALFYLRRQDRRTFRTGNPAQRVAAGLLDRPNRLLTVVLFWNLAVNVAYFAISSIISLGLQQRGQQPEAGAFALGSLLAIIFFSEMLPKTLAVVQTRILATAVSIPMALSARILDPLLPVFRFVNLISRRLFWPRFQVETYLELDDLQRAIDLSTSDRALADQERTVLQNIVTLSDLRVDEMMRPRTQLLSFRPPVALADLQGKMTPSGHLLITEPDGEDIVATIPLKYLFHVPEEHLEHHAEKVSYVPWCSTAAAALEEMRRRDHQVVAVVNEFGETIGILTFDDILATIFSAHSSRSERLLETTPIQQIEPHLWHVTGMTSLRRLTRHFELRLPETKAVTMGGVIQEVLQRMPAAGDQCRWGPFQCKVLEVSQGGLLTVELSTASPNQTQGRGDDA